MMGVNRLLPQVTLPEQSNEGILTGAVNTALLLVSPNLSVPPESANRSVWPLAGRSSEHVSSDSCSVLEDVSNAFFESRAACNPETSAIVLAPVEA